MEINVSPRKRILVTGVNGFIGKHIYKHFLHRGYDVFCIERNALAETKSQCIQADIKNLKSLPDNIDTIIHSAASPISPERFYDDNILATQNLVQLAVNSGVRKFVFFSAMSVYGKISNNIIDENTEIVFPSDYGASKLAGEKYLLSFKNKITPFILRMPGIVGPFSHRNWLSRIKSQVLNGELIELYNPYALFNNTLHINDLCKLCETLSNIDHKGGIFNLASESPISILGALKIFDKQLHTKSNWHSLNSENISWTISIEKVKEELGYFPATTEEVISQFALE